MKHDVFRALARSEGHHCTLLSRRGHVYTQFPMLQTEIAHAIRAHIVSRWLVCETIRVPFQLHLSRWTFASIPWFRRATEEIRC